MSISKGVSTFIKGNWRYIARFTGAEMINLLLTAVAGFLMVRHLSKEAYGVYGFLNTATMLIISLSEVGINHCFLPLIGYTNITNERVNAVYKLFRLRRTNLLIISTIVVMPFVIYLMYKRGWVNIVYILSVLGMLVAGYFAVNEQLYRQKFTALHQSNIVSNTTLVNGIIKAVWTVISLYCFRNDGVIIILLACNGIAGSVAAIIIYRKAKPPILPILTQSIDFVKLNIEFKKIYNPLRFPAFLYVLYGSFGGLAIGYFGNAITIADVNAAGRLVMFLIIVDRLSGAFIMPRLAQAANFKKYLKLVLSAHLIYVLFASAIIFFAWLFPTPLLFLIGEKYTNLKGIIWLAFLGGILSNLSGFTFTCLSSRGFTSNQLPILICGVVSQILAIIWLGMHDAMHVFVINIITAAVFAGGNLYLLSLQVRKRNTGELIISR